MDQAGEHGRPADDAGGYDLGIARLEPRLHGIEGLAVDDRRDRNGHDLADRLQFLSLTALVELMLAHVGAAGENAVNLPDAPAPTVAGEDAALVEIGDDVLDAHLTGRSVAFQCEAVDQPHRVGVKRIDLQLLFGLGPALLGSDHTVADGRKGTVPEALPRVLLQGPHYMLGVFLGLILVEQRHDLPHHDVHRIVAHFLCDGNQLDAVLGQLPNVELQLEVVAEEPAERMDHDDIEGRRLRRARLDHALELGAAIVGGRCSGLHEGLDELVTARGAIGFALPLLVGDRHIMLGLPRRRNAKIERGAQGD